MGNDKMNGCHEKLTRGFGRVVKVAAAIAAVMVVTAAGAAEENTLSLADARAQIDAAIADSATMTRLTKGLPAADQVAFLAAVNEAISRQPGSADERTAKYLAAVRGALKGSAKGNAAKMLAEVFATVPPEALTVVNEDLAANVINRWADPAQKYTDERYMAICTNLMNAVIERVATAEGNPSVRATFAAVMLDRASQGGPAAEGVAGKGGLNVAYDLVGMIPNAEEADTAAKEWLPSALGRDATGNQVPKTYEPILAYGRNGLGDGKVELPNMVIVHRLTPQMKEQLMLQMLAMGVPDVAGTLGNVFKQEHSAETSGLFAPRGVEVPKTLLNRKWNPDRGRDGSQDKVVPAKKEEPYVPHEPDPYFGQRVDSVL